MAVQDVPNPLVHRITLNPGNEVRKAKTKLDEVLEEKETRAALRYSAAEMEKMALESENEARRLRGEPLIHGGVTMNDETRRAEEAKQREQLMNSAKALIDSGMEPKQVGQMLLGLTPTSTTAGYPPTQGMGMGYDDVLKFVNLIIGKKETDELKTIITSLDKKVDDLAKGGGDKGGPIRPPTPMEYARQQGEYIAALKELGLIREPEVRTAEGESLDVVKEKNRHYERLEEIKADREYKQSVVEIATDIPDRIGRGLGAQLIKGEGGGGGKGGLEYIICSEPTCRYKIPITPETGSRVECPKCSAIYQQRETSEAEQE